MPQKNSIICLDKHYSQNIGDKLFNFILLLFIFILPIKFTVPAMLPNSGVFPIYSSDWIVGLWSASFFPVISAILLILCIIRLMIIRISSSLYELTIPLLWTILAGTSLLGFINASCMDFPILETSYIFGISAFSLLIFLRIFSNEELSIKIINTLVICSLLLSFYALYQYFFGFENTREYVAELIKNTSVSLPENMIQRLKDDQVFSTFAISNNFAGYLILVMPLAIFSIFYSPFNGSKLFKNIFASLLSILLILTLILTGSRSAILSLIIAFLLICIFIFNIRKWLLLLLSLLSTALIVLLFFIFAKGIATIIVRFDYFNTALVLLKKHLLMGAGWGSFFHSYPFLKEYMTGEAPNDPHNFLLSLGSQSGIVTLILGVAIFLIPIFLAFKHLKSLPKKEMFQSLELPLLLGYTAWFIHSMTDTNFQIAGSLTIAIIFSALILKYSQKDQTSKNRYALYLTLLMSLASIIAIFGLGGNRIFGEYYLANLYSVCYNNPILNQNIDNHTADKSENFNNSFKNAVKYMPYSPFPLAAAAQYEERLNNLALAETYMKEALILSPERSSFYYDLSIILSKEGKRPDALYCLKIASELFPYQYKRIYEQANKNNL
ncbi:MAG: O-antigen ligase family protein [Lentisphaerota bacterium]